MRSFASGIFIAVPAVMLLFSCSTTRRLSSGEYLLRRTEVRIAQPDYDSAGVAKNDRITARELSAYERQAPNKRFLGINFSSWIYSAANPAKNNWWNNTKRRMGSPPVILDTVLTGASAEAMKIYMDSRGYLTSGIRYDIDTARRKADVTYYANPGYPYTIASFGYDFRDGSLGGVILGDTASTLIRRGDLFDTNVLSEERNRITNYLRDRGYYDFTASNIYYSVDTARHSRDVDVTMVVRQYAAGMDESGETVPDDNKVYRIRDIYVYLDYDPNGSGSSAAGQPQAAGGAIANGVGGVGGAAAGSQGADETGGSGAGAAAAGAANGETATGSGDGGNLSATTNGASAIAGGATGNWATTNGASALTSAGVPAGNDPGLPGSQNNLYNPNAAGRLDTIYYEGLNIIYESHPEVRPEVIRRAVSLLRDNLYDASQVRRTYNNLMLLGYYRSANIQFRESGTALTDGAYTGAPMPDSTRTETDDESYLICDIYLSPQKKQSITTEFEGTTTSDYYGLILRLGYQNRNIFRGAELFDIGLRGGYEFLRNNTGRSSFEIGGTASVTFPRFIAPSFVNRHNRTFNPKTRAELAYNMQQRPYYRRTISSAAWSYSWGNGRNSTFILRPVDVNVIKMGSIDQNFLDSQQNPYLKDSYKSQVVAGLSGSYIYNNQLRSVNSNSTILRVNFETNGNLLGGIFNLTEGRSEDPHRLFGTPFAQYFRIDANYSRRIALGERSSVVYRLYGGWALNYGNGRSIPFDRFFYSGGLNSMRGWVSRTLGPGNTPQPVKGDHYYPSQVGNLKLEANLEGRFPIMGIVDGAVFFDLGNVWWTGNTGYIPTETGEGTKEGQFEPRNFYKQLGFNTGLGMRLDFNLFVFRLDWGLQLHNPNLPAGERWIEKFSFRRSTLNFGVGYPF